MQHDSLVIGALKCRVELFGGVNMVACGTDFACRDRLAGWRSTRDTGQRQHAGGQDRHDSSR